MAGGSSRPDQGQASGAQPVAQCKVIRPDLSDIRGWIIEADNEACAKAMGPLLLGEQPLHSGGRENQHVARIAPGAGRIKLVEVSYPECVRPGGTQGSQHRAVFSAPAGTPTRTGQCQATPPRRADGSAGTRASTDI